LRGVLPRRTTKQSPSNNYIYLTPCIPLS